MATNATIQLADISQELAKLWEVEQGQKKTRASFFNLILYVQQAEKKLYQKLIKTVIGKFPCRVILILCGENKGESYLKTSVSSELIEEGQQHLFCEMIQIEVAGSLIERVPYIILPQILPDLPIYLLWTQDPSVENCVLPYLEPFANRIIFDPRLTFNLQNYSRTVLKLTDRFHCGIGDFNWSACSGWRQLFGQVFNTPEALTSLVQSNVIRIQYNTSRSSARLHNEIIGLYFQAWLASRLNWQFQAIENNEGNIRLSYKRPLHQVVILLTPQEIETLAPGAIISIEIESARNQNHYSFKRDLQSKQVFVQCSEKELCHLPYTRLLNCAEGQEMVEEIFYPSGGQHYRDMLRLLSTIPWKQNP